VFGFEAKQANFVANSLFDR